MKTTLTHYDFDISSPTENEAYKELTATLKKTNGKCFRVLPNPTGCKPPEGEISLDVSNINNIWENQWNTTCGFRVFDWYEAIYSNRDIKKGYYLTITPEMNTLRSELLRCGYCGHTVASPQSFCTSCIGSIYLEASDLKLLRMMPVSSSASREELSEEELAMLTEELNKAQMRAIHRKYSMEEQARQYEEEEKIFQEAEDRLAGHCFLLNNHLSQDNCIYYAHTGVFCFGWKRPLPDAAADYLEELLEGFPAKYEIKRSSL